MREDIVFEELIEQIDLILNSSKPLPYHMKAERKLAEVLRHLQEIPEYDNLKQFEPLFDVESFLIHFLASADYTDLLKIIDRSTMKFKHIDDYNYYEQLSFNITTKTCLSSISTSISSFVSIKSRKLSLS